MLSRFKSLEGVGQRGACSQIPQQDVLTSSEQFGMHVFNRKVMQKKLPRKIYQNIVNAMEGKEKIRQEYADPIAAAMKEWALSLGATHYTHWFQPLTGASAEKHDAFIEWHSADRMIEQFTGKQLIQGEPDASSFPSGGLRSTYEARGYTGWDPTSPVFIWNEGRGTTLYIPSVFFSWTGDVLDSKIPFHRAEKKLNEQVLRLLRLTGVKAQNVYTTIGLEQEYFVIDRALRNLRPDLMLCGRTVFGAPSPKGQELQDHYFGSVKERILCFMHDFEMAALKLGIPVKTRHNEVAPAQYEVAPIYERSSIAIDHNIQLMELMRKIAVRHDLAVLLHEKPFDGLNGSGKHCNWSIATDSGHNLLDPCDTPQNNLHFLVLLTAIIHAVHQHSALLRASIGSAANDCRLGGHEAPPAIISVYLGEAVEQLLLNIEKEGTHKGAGSKHRYDLGMLHLPDLTKDYTDRNRTSPFAFTGSKFEFRALGASASPAMAVTVLNAIVAESLGKMMDAIEKKLEHKKTKTHTQLLEAIIPVVQEYLKASRAVRFSGDNYSHSWVEEAAKRQLPNIKKSIHAFQTLLDPKTTKVFAGILTPEEIRSRYEILIEHFSHAINIEVNLMLDLFKTSIVPASLKYQKQLAKTLQVSEAVVKDVQPKHQQALLKNLIQVLEDAMGAADQLEKARKKADDLDLEEKAEWMSHQVLSLMHALRHQVDFLETLVDDQLWSLPKYRELLFSIQ